MSTTLTHMCPTQLTTTVVATVVGDTREVNALVSK